MDLSICVLAALQQPERWPLVILGYMFLLPAMRVRRLWSASLAIAAQVRAPNAAQQQEPS